MNEIITVEQPQMLEAINRSEIDVQIATAKRYPREVDTVLKRVKTLALTDAESAQGCFYALKRQGKIIEGLSVRMAEILADCWGNIRTAARIIGNDGKTITAQGVCHDLETNTAVSVEVKRRITDKDGRTYSEDMQVTTGNAACAIAYRNAVLKIIPKAVTAKTIKQIKEVAFQGGFNPVDSYNKWAEYFRSIKVTEPMLLYYLGITDKAEYGKEQHQSLVGVYNAITEGQTTAKECFIDPYNALQAMNEANKAAEAVSQAMAKSKK